MDFTRFIKEKTVLGGQADNEDEFFHISLGITKDYAVQAGVVINSILDNNPKVCFMFHIFCDDIKEIDIQRFKILSEKYIELTVVLYYVNADEFKYIKTSQRYSQAAFYRIISAALLYPQIKKILYLDSDLMCLNSFKKLRDLDINSICMAVQDSGSWIEEHKCEIGLPREHVYFNSGVIYMNLEKWNEANVSEKAMKLLAENEFSFCDQDALNISIGSRYQMLSERYNHFYMNGKHQEVPLPKDTVFLHFAGDIKPWQPWCQNKLKALWEKALENSPWRGYVYIPRNYQENRLMGKVLRKQGRYVEALSWYCRYVLDKIKTKMK